MGIDDAGPARGVPLARRHPLLRRYPLRRRSFAVGGSALDVVVPDERTWLRDGTGGVAPPGGRGDEGWEPPYWMRVWPAAIAMARSVACLGNLSGMRVLDLGCGLGLPGCSASRGGAAVEFVDREVSALAFAEWNARAQGGCGTIVATRLDWAAATVPGSFDIVLMSDVSYHPMHHAGLLKQLRRALLPAGLVLHTDPIRAASTDFLNGVGAEFRSRVGLRVVREPGIQALVRVVALAGSDEVLSGWLRRGKVLGEESSESQALIEARAAAQAGVGDGGTETNSTTASRGASWR